MTVPTAQAFPELAVSLTLHSGRAVAQSVVRPGDTVSRGQLVAVPGDARGVRVYAPAGGTVDFPHAGSAAVRIRVASDGFEQLPAALSGDASDLACVVRECGILGHGGAGFPLHVKLAAARSAGACALVLNAVECETPLDCDRALLAREGRAVLRGMEALRTYLGLPSFIIAVSTRTASAGRAALAGSPAVPASVIVAGDEFTAGDERILLRTLFGRSVRKQPLPCDEGYLVVNVGTAAAVDLAVSAGHPPLSRWVTLADARGVRSTVELPFGARVRDVLRSARIEVGVSETVFSGGDRTGIAVNLDEGISAGTACLRVAETPKAKPAGLPCIRCGDCNAACPYTLPVHEMVRAGLHGAPLGFIGGDPERARQAWSECTLCGRCEPVCPSRIPLSSVLAEAKRSVRESTQRQVDAASASARFERHQKIVRVDEASTGRSENATMTIAAAVARSRKRRGRTV